MVGKIAAITGATKGLGLALAKALAAEGWGLSVGGRNEQDLNDARKHILESGKENGRKEKEEKNHNILTVMMNVKKQADCNRFIKETASHFGKIDLLVNNAGIWDMTDVENITGQHLKDLFQTNTFGPMYCASAAIRVMKKQGCGHILNIGSTAGVKSKPDLLAYCGSKFAITGMTGSLFEKLQGTGIRISLFSPGGMKTQLFRKTPSMMKNDFMDPAFAAQKILEHINNPNDSWHVILYRDGRIERMG